MVIRRKVAISFWENLNLSGYGDYVLVHGFWLSSHIYYASILVNFDQSGQFIVDLRRQSQSVMSYAPTAGVPVQIVISPECSVRWVCLQNTVPFYVLSL